MDVFEKFINTFLKYYGLEAYHYFSSHGLSWDAMLKMTKIELELISSIGVHLLVEKGMRGGISYIAKRYSKPNNKYMKDYDCSKESKFITYLDANNLCGWAKSLCLPCGGFKWLSIKEIDKLDVNSLGENSSIGYILEVDLEYPVKLHNLHNDYPLALEKNITK